MKIDSKAKRIYKAQKLRQIICCADGRENDLSHDFLTEICNFYPDSNDDILYAKEPEDEGILENICTIWSYENFILELLKVD